MTSLPLEFDDDTGGRPRKKLLPLAGPLLLCFFLGTGVGLVFLAKFGSFPSLESIQEYRPSISSMIYDRYNKVVGEIYLAKRNLVPYRQIPHTIVNAFVAAEDANFFQHKGVDLTAIARAAVKDLVGGSFAQGGGGSADVLREGSGRTRGGGGGTARRPSQGTQPLLAEDPPRPREGQAAP